MSARSKRECLVVIFKTYSVASREIETALLNEFSSTRGYYRKHVIRLLQTFQRSTHKTLTKLGRRPTYDP